MLQPLTTMVEDEFSSFYNAHFKRVKRSALSILGDDMDSLGVTDVAMWYAFCNPEKFREMSYVDAEAYLLKIVRSRSYDELRARRRHSYVDIALIDNTTCQLGREEVEREIELSDFIDAMERCVRSMPDAYRDTLFLRFIEEMTLPQIAEVLGVPFNTVKTRYRRGIQMLRKFVTDKGYDTL